jgi:hypothetical protein
LPSYTPRHWVARVPRGAIPLTHYCGPLRGDLGRVIHDHLVQTVCTDPTENTASNRSSIFVYLLRRSRDLVAVEMCLETRCLATAVTSGSAIPNFSRHVTILRYIFLSSYKFYSLEIWYLSIYGFSVFDDFSHFNTPVNVFYNSPLRYYFSTFSIKQYLIPA